MPNWCYNKIRIGCVKPGDMKKIKEFLQGEDTCFDLNNIVPMPEELKGTTSPSESVPGGKPENWYDWSVKNWGCKWNTSEARIEYECEEDEDIEYAFDTPWAEPEPAIKALRKKFPDAHISAFFDEPGMEHAGYY